MTTIFYSAGPHKRKHSEMDMGSKISVPSVTDAQKISLSQLAARHSSQSPSKLHSGVKTEHQSRVTEEGPSTSC